MLKPLKPLQSSWTCSRCLRQLSQRRLSSSVVATATSARKYPSAISPASHSSPDGIHDDNVLRSIFDSQPFWKSFTSQGAQLHRHPVGLFQNRYLTRAEGFRTFALTSLRKCQRLVAKIASATTFEEYRQVVRDMDRLSDLLCRVIDLADFVRNTHPDRAIQAAAGEAYATMFEYMNVLNTTPELDLQLGKAMKMPEVTEGWTEEEKVVAEQLKRDFSKSAIDLPQKTRQRFVDLSNDISQAGAQLLDTMGPEKATLDMNATKLTGMNQRVVREITSWGQVKLPTTGPIASLAMKRVEDPDVRREIYIANRTASTDSIGHLEDLLSSRAELAQLSGYESFGHMALSDKMASSPEAVEKFLSALAADNRPRVQAEIKELLALKRGDARAGNFPDELNAWDRAYYAARLVQDLRPRSTSSDSTLSAYFSLGTVMQGLSRIFHRLYGIRLVPKATAPGEAWNNDVRRLDVVDDTLGHIGVIYCDLFERDGKSPNPSHFTLRCSRVISPQELHEEPDEMGDVQFASAEEAATDGMAAARDPRDGQLHQLPTIALICDFARAHATSSDPRPTLLSFFEVQTLFHEMGHAAHSFLGRTTFQNVSGTRCAADLSELPSVLFERFASSPVSLALFARHWHSDKPLSPRLVAEAMRVDQAFAAADDEAQILMAILDQRCHAIRPQAHEEKPKVDSTALYHAVYNQYASVPEPAGTAWQGFFGHLFGYGATYYAYLFDRAIASRIWQKVFLQGEKGQGADELKLDWGAGERFRDEVLRWGGSRDGWKCVGGVLKDDRLAEGGEMAMAEVGKWGVV